MDSDDSSSDGFAYATEMSDSDDSSESDHVSDDIVESTNKIDATITITGTPTGFHGFSNMPNELQAMVWRRAIPRLQAYEFDFSYGWDWNGPNKFMAYFQPSDHTRKDILPHRTLLQTCRASRNEVLALFDILTVHYKYRWMDHYRTAYVPFDKQFGIFCVGLPLDGTNMTDDLPWDFEEIAYGFNPVSEFKFAAWYEKNFAELGGMEFTASVRKLGLVVALPHPEQDVDSDLYNTEESFVLFTLAFVLKFQPLDKTCLIADDALYFNDRHDPDFLATMPPLSDPQICKYPGGRDNGEVDMMRDIAWLCMDRRVLVLEELSLIQDMDPENVWNGDDLRSYEELRQIHLDSLNDLSNTGSEESEI